MRNKQKNLIRKFSEDEAKDLAIFNMQTPYNPRFAIKELAEKQLPHAMGKKMTEDVAKNMIAVSIAYSLDSGHALMESIEKKYKPLALQMKKELIEEFDCKSASEKALVDQIVNSHIRKLSYSMSLEAHRDPEFMSQIKTSYMDFLSREIDRAHRQFISALETLKSFKQPEINLMLNIQSKNAFIAKNQQFNNQNETSENNESK